MPQAMIVSLGGSPEPLIKTLSEQRPQIVCFLASQASVDLVGKIKEETAKNGVSFHDHKGLVDDPDDLALCYQKALSCTAWVSQQGVQADEVVVDYTGGTKTMSAALVLATVSQGFRFSYVGGTLRTKGGLGVVISGSEEVRLGPNPWELFAVQERLRLAQYFNSYQFAACRVLIQEIADRVSPEEKERFAVLRAVVEGYEAWDGFSHRRALRRLEEATAKLQHLEALRAAGNLSSLAPGISANVRFLRSLKEHTNDFQALHPMLLHDLLANAQRRLDEGKFDDAAARLYRLVEMIGQIEVWQRCGAKTEDFPLKQIPESLREEFVRRYRDAKDNKIKLPLEATYRILQEQGSETGQRFFRDRGRFSNLQQARNQSILAHGVTPIEERRVRELLDFLSALMPQQEAPRFPELKVE